MSVDDAGRLGLRALADLATPMAVRVAATLRVADHIAGRARTPAELAAVTGTHAGALDRLLLHLVSVGLFTRDDSGAYTATELGEQLRDGHPRSKRKWLDMNGAIGKGDLSFVDLAHAVKTGEESYSVRHGVPFWDDLSGDAELSASFDALMGHHIALDNSGIVDAYDWASLGHVVDVAGGSGALLEALLLKHSKLRGTLVDLPGPAANARERFAENGQAHRVDVVPGSFFDPLPAGADAYVLSAIIHDWDDEPSVAILKRCAEAAGDDGVVLLVEAIGSDGETPNTGMDLRMLIYNGGKERGLSELAELARRAGLRVRGTHKVGQKSYMSIVELAKA
ncbi:methyltransferase [Amycolatopsis sp. cmx-11-12]|uniref:methyltransferase n=1 Tax=Amycolatopsis sp. cmx-11-12 TaxID=2785795 RepID=UPI0039185ADD